MKVVIATGGFDPIHSGHIEYLKAAKMIAGEDGLLIVGVNSDGWLKRKKGKSFLPWHERVNIVSSIRYVDEVIGFDDNDDSAIDCIKQVRDMFTNADIIFVNGGDRTSTNIPELDCKDALGVSFLFGVGGTDKKNSSSWILEKWIQ
jgi:D-beta-D-heptose 7-phosphate kinase/D-beta-D-heptose 1-phosphate adenosyltransferase